MNHPRSRSFKPGMTTAEFVAVLLVIGAILVFLLFYHPPHRGSDRSHNIINIRNCQQAMRHHQKEHGLKPGDSFTREDLEQYMKFPSNLKVKGGKIVYTAGTVITAPADDPPKNGNHLWLKVSGPGIKDYVGKFGFDSLEDTADW